MTVWPMTLPQEPLAEGYRETPGDQTVRTQMETGRAKVRRRSSAAPVQIDMVFMMTKGQVGILESFFDQTLKGGALDFSFKHPRKGQEVQCRFLRPPVLVAQNGLYFRVGVELEVLP